MTRVAALALALLLSGCATQAQLAGIAAKAKIPQECRYIGRTPEISDLGTKKNTLKIVDAMGGGNVLIVVGRRIYGGLAALGNTWWGDLYDCAHPKQYDGADIIVLSEVSAHPLDTRTSEESSSVRITSNPEAVRGCKFLANVNDQTEGEITNGVYTVRQAVLRYNAVKVGGDIVLLTSDPHTGEAYRCGAEPAPGEPPKPSAARCPPALGLASELYTRDGQVIGIVSAIEGETVTIRLRNGGETKVSREQAAKMLERPDAK